MEVDSDKLLAIFTDFLGYPCSWKTHNALHDLDILTYDLPIRVQACVVTGGLLEKPNNPIS